MPSWRRKVAYGERWDNFIAYQCLNNYLGRDSEYSNKHPVCRVHVRPVIARVRLPVEFWQELAAIGTEINSLYKDGGESSIPSSVHRFSRWCAKLVEEFDPRSLTGATGDARRVTAQSFFAKRSADPWFCVETASLYYNKRVAFLFGCCHLDKVYKRPYVVMKSYLDRSPQVQTAALGTRAFAMEPFSILQTNRLFNNKYDCALGANLMPRPVYCRLDEENDDDDVAILCVGDCRQDTAHELVKGDWAVLMIPDIDRPVVTEGSRLVVQCRAVRASGIVGSHAMEVETSHDVDMITPNKPDRHATYDTGLWWGRAENIALFIALQRAGDVVLPHDTLFRSRMLSIAPRCNTWMPDARSRMEDLTQLLAQADDDLALGFSAETELALYAHNPLPANMHKYQIALERLERIMMGDVNQDSADPSELDSPAQVYKSLVRVGLVSPRFRLDVPVEYVRKAYHYGPASLSSASKFPEEHNGMTAEDVYRVSGLPQVHVVASPGEKPVLCREDDKIAREFAAVCQTTLAKGSVKFAKFADLKARNPEVAIKTEVEYHVKVRPGADAVENDAAGPQGARVVRVRGQEKAPAAKIAKK